MNTAAITQEIERLAQRGLRLLPCAVQGKRPLLDNWPTLASSDLVTIQGWEAEHPGCNWGVATGPASGVFVLDVDGKAGRASLAALEAECGPLPVTLKSVTGRQDGGEHRWFKYPADREVRGRVGKLGTGLDIRGAGGLVIVPPSVHKSGRPYQWDAPQYPIADAPNWLLERLSDTTAKPHKTPAERSILPVGQRNDGLTRYAGALRRKGADLHELERRLLEANTRRCQPPLEDDEVLGIAASVVRYPVGGPDPLELAWQASQSEAYSSNEARFLGLCRHLQKCRANQDIALPLKRIGELMDLHWTRISDFRKAAVKRGVLDPTDQYVAHRRAGRYRFIETASHEKPTTLTRSSPLTKPLTTGLVRKSHSENLHSENGVGAGGRIAAFPHCPRCRSYALYRRNNTGNYECQTCGLLEIEESVARRLP